MHFRLFLVAFLSFFVISQELDLKNIDPNLLKDLTPEQIAAIQDNSFFEENDDEPPKEETLQDKTDENNETLELQETRFGYDFFLKTPTTISPTQDLPVPNGYKISLQDEITVLLSGAKDAQYDLKVNLDGSILFPELGSISVINQSLQEVRSKISALVDQSYVGVNVDVSVSNLSAKKITIVGAVNVPGTYLVNPFTTISNAIAYAGGIKEYASLRNIFLTKQNGEKHSFDLYDLLVDGDRTNDIVVSAGDTIVVNGTSNFVEINGSVIRPMIYEYTESDSYEDLIRFALGLNSKADSNNISSIVVENGRSYSQKAKFDEVIGSKILLEVFVGTDVTTDDKDLFVTGNGVTSGYFPASGENLADFLDELKFSSDIYPFYAIYEQEFNSGLSRKITAFSLADPSTYINLKATKNSRLFFYDRDYILDFYKTKVEASAEDADPEIIEAAEAYDEENPALQSDYAQIFLPGNNIRMPVIGKLSPKQIHLFLGGTESIDLENVAVITTESSSSNSYNLVFDSSNLVAISFPPVRQNLIEVSITGEVRNPGTFLVSSSTKLTELYILSGGFLPNSFQDGISLFREDVKEKQIKALREAKAILTDSLVQKSTSVSERGAIDIEAVLELADLVEPTGRVAGDFSENSDIANKFILKDGDIIIVPAVSVEVTVQGEVLNSSSFIFDADMDYNDYIQASGGYTSFADKRAAFIIRANGESTPVGNNIFSGQADIYPGDTIVIPRDLDQLEALPLISMATKIISDIAFSAASLNAIQD